MTINTRRLRASLPAVTNGRPVAPKRGREHSYALWLLALLPVAALFAFHFVSDFLARS
ncbi:MAG: hypothetical protein Q8M31_00135 [Beijerinckiaceae bacterium]|nr:hypothetical protein [Beijerinckiaceae bacterium]